MGWAESGRQMSRAVGGLAMSRREELKWPCHLGDVQRIRRIESDHIPPANEMQVEVARSVDDDANDKIRSR